MASQITRHFATIHNGRWGDRQVHYRRAGKGPVIILLHQSPLSSRDMLATMKEWKREFTCIAPDTPGYGLSDPLGVPHAQMEDFAQALAEFLDAIGVSKAALYGFHTGAMVAAAFALRYPERTCCAVSNGYVILTEQERADIVAHYLPAFEPAWDGSHLTWLFSRMREQTIFFPWYSKRLEHRLQFDVPAPEALQAGIVDFLRAGDHYRVGYRAAFTMRSDEALRLVAVPTLVIASRFDATAQYLARVRETSPHVKVVRGGTFEQTRATCLDFIRASKPPAAPALVPTLPIAGRMWQQMIDLPEGQLRVRRNTDAAGRVVVIQHDAAGSSDIVEPIARSFIGLRPVLAIDLPGHGESDAWLPKRDVTVAQYSDALDAALVALDIDSCDFFGWWGGGLVGYESSLRRGTRVRKVVLADLVYFSKALQAELRANYTPDIRPDWYGGYLLQAWHLMRDQALFWPWYRRTRAGIIGKPAYIDSAMVHKRVLEMFKAPQMWRAAYQAHFSYPIKQKLKRARVPVLLAAPWWDPNYDHTLEAARDNPKLPFLKLPDDPATWGPELMPFFERR